MVVRATQVDPGDPARVELCVPPQLTGQQRPAGRQGRDELAVTAAGRQRNGTHRARPPAAANSTAGAGSAGRPSRTGADSGSDGQLPRQVHVTPLSRTGARLTYTADTAG